MDYMDTKVERGDYNGSQLYTPMRTFQSYDQSTPSSELTCKQTRILHNINNPHGNYDYPKISNDQSNTDDMIKQAFASVLSDKTNNV